MAEASERPICFIICPIGERGSETRRRADQLRKYLFNPVAEDICGYKTIRADEISEPGIITAQIIQHLMDDPLVIADLTDFNPNVFYELAVRHAVRKPVVQLIDHKVAIPFDVAVQRTIKVDYRDLDSIEFCKSELEQQIRAVVKDPSLVDNPISFAINLKLGRDSDNPIVKSNSEIMASLASLTTEVRSLVQTQELRARFDSAYRNALGTSYVGTGLVHLASIPGTIPENSIWGLTPEPTASPTKEQREEQEKLRKAVWKRVGSSGSGKKPEGDKGVAASKEEKK
jgi:hypothetical protein